MKGSNKIATRFPLVYPELIEKFILENPIGLEDWKVKMPYLPVDLWYQFELKQDHNSLKKYQLENYFDGLCVTGLPSYYPYNES